MTDWLPMSSAPRNGTIIEIQCTYGYKPTYGLFRWDDTTFPGEPWWLQVSRRADPTSLGPGMNGRFAGKIPAGTTKVAISLAQAEIGYAKDDSLSWRPYPGKVAEYIDPTNGAQDSKDYWLDALPKKKSLWERLWS